MGRSVLLASLGQYVKEAVDSHQLFVTPAERAVRLEDFAFRVFVEDTVSRSPRSPYAETLPAEPGPGEADADRVVFAPSAGSVTWLGSMESRCLR